jgi:hypothetical protein
MLYLGIDQHKRQLTVNLRSTGSTRVQRGQLNGVNSTGSTLVNGVNSQRGQLLRKPGEMAIDVWV